MISLLQNKISIPSRGLFHIDYIHNIYLTKIPFYLYLIDTDIVRKSWVFSLSDVCFHYFFSVVLGDPSQCIQASVKKDALSVLRAWS